MQNEDTFQLVVLLYGKIDWTRRQEKIRWEDFIPSSSQTASYIFYAPIHEGKLLFQISKNFLILENDNAEVQRLQYDFFWM